MAHKPTIRAGHMCTIHRDGTVSYYRPSRRQWIRQQMSAMLPWVIDNDACLTPDARKKCYKAIRQDLLAYFDANKGDSDKTCWLDVSRLKKS